MLRIGTPGDASLGEIVRGNFHSDFIAGQDADVVHTQFTGNMRVDYVTVSKLDFESRIRHCIHNGTFNFNDIIF